MKAAPESESDPFGYDTPFWYKKWADRTRKRNLAFERIRASYKFLMLRPIIVKMMDAVAE